MHRHGFIQTRQSRRIILHKIHGILPIPGIKQKQSPHDDGFPISLFLRSHVKRSRGDDAFASNQVFQMIIEDFFAETVGTGFGSIEGEEEVWRSVAAVVATEGVVADVTPSVEGYGGDVDGVVVGIGVGVVVVGEEGADDRIAGESFAAIGEGWGVDAHYVPDGSLKVGGEDLMTPKNIRHTLRIESLVVQILFPCPQDMIFR
mmetsp:Transcript_19326/g.39615  ORF Transcript_19326/g.39615 Transcript_19326/m.39615 type:complete len:203 (-) Transcript_19326:631-1239(-)